MTKEKQIEEMAKDFCAVGIPCEECHLYKNRCHAKKYATRAYNNGYRKASEVAKEMCGFLRDDLSGFVDKDYLERLIEIYEKKYTGKDINVTTNKEGGE